MHNVHAPSQYSTGGGVQAQLNVGVAGAPHSNQTSCLISPLDAAQHKAPPSCKGTSVLRQWRKHPVPVNQPDLGTTAVSAPCQLMPPVSGGPAAASIARVAPQMHYQHHASAQQQQQQQHHQQQHQQYSPYHNVYPPVQYSQIVEKPLGGAQAPPKTAKDMDMMLGHHRPWSWGQHDVVGDHLGGAYAPPHRQYSAGHQGVSRPPQSQQPSSAPSPSPFSAETNPYLAQLHKINPRVAQSIITDTLLDQTRLFNTHMYHPNASLYAHNKPSPTVSNYHPQGPYSPSGYYATQKPQQQGAPYKYNAHVEQPTRNISPVKRGFADGASAAAAAAAAARYHQKQQQPYFEYAQHYQHRTGGVAPARHFPGTYYTGHQQPPSAANVYDAPYQFQTPTHAQMQQRLSASNKDGAAAGGGGNINLKTFLESWNEEDIENTQKVAKGTELYVYDSTDISTDAIGQYLHIQQVDKLPENIRGYLEPSPSPTDDETTEHKSVIKENVSLQTPPQAPPPPPPTTTPTPPPPTTTATPTPPPPTTTATPTPPPLPTTPPTPLPNISKKDEPKDYSCKNVAPAPETTKEPDDVPPIEQVEPCGSTEQIESPTVVIPPAAEGVIEAEPLATETTDDAIVPEAEPVATQPDDDDLQIETVQINNRETIKINQNNIMLQIGDDMCLEIDVNSEGGKVITVKTNQGSWQLLEMPDEKKCAEAPPSPLSPDNPECTDVVNIQDWVHGEEEVSSQDDAVVLNNNNCGDEIIQENKIESSEKTGVAVADAPNRKRLYLKRLKRLQEKKRRALKQRTNGKRYKAKATRKVVGGGAKPHKSVVPNDVPLPLPPPTKANVVDKNKNDQLPYVYLLKLEEMVDLSTVNGKVEQIESRELKELTQKNIMCKRKAEGCAVTVNNNNNNNVKQRSSSSESDDVFDDKLSSQGDARPRDANAKRRLSLEEYNNRKQRLDNERRQSEDQYAHPSSASTLTNDLLDVKSITSRKLSTTSEPETIPLSLPLSVAALRSKEDVMRSTENLRQLQETKDIVRRFLNKECLSRTELLKVHEIIKFKSLLTKKGCADDLFGEAVPDVVTSCAPQLKRKRRRRFRNLYSDEDDEGRLGPPVLEPQLPTATRDPRLLFGKRSGSLVGGEAAAPANNNDDDVEKNQVPTIIIKKNGSAYSSSVKP